MGPPSGERSAERVLCVVAALAREARRGAMVDVSLDIALEQGLGLDSLGRVELILRLEQEFGVSLPEEALASAETPRDLLRFLRGAAAPGREPDEHAVASLVQPSAASTPAAARTLTEAYLWHLERQPDRLSVHLYGDRREHQFTYRSLYEGALGYSAALADAGLVPGQTVAIMLPTGPEYLFCLYGVLFAGAIPVPLYPPARLSAIEDHLSRHARILGNARASFLVTIPEARTLAYLLKAQVETLRAVLTPDDLAGGARGFSPVMARGGDIAFLQYTSGSTGQPKGVVLTHENLLANLRWMGRAAGVGPTDVFVSWLPLYHDMGLIGGCFATMYHGFPVALLSPLAFLGKPSQWLRAIHRHRGTISGGPNFCYELCLKRIQEAEVQDLDLSSWRFAFNGAEPVSPETIRAFERRFAPHGLRANVMAPVYGLAECCVGLAFNPPGEPWRVDTIDRELFSRTGEARAARPGDPAPLEVVNCGRVIPEHDLRVVDSAGFELPERQEGSLQFRGPSATSGYYRNAKATESLFDGPWLRTGDRAYLAEGMLHVTGREKEIIIRGGRNVSPYELEEAIGDLPGIRRGCVAVFGSPDREAGTERIVVLAETRESDAPRQAELYTRINALAVSLIGAPPDDVVFAPPQSVPKTSSGKIRRVAAREYYERGAGAVKPPPVWLQLARLAASALVPQMRRGLRVLGGLAFAARVWFVFAVLFPPAWLVAALAPPRITWRFGHRISRGFFRLAGIPLAARGLENIPGAGPVVLAANHASYLDAPALLALLAWRHWAFVAKREFLADFFMRTLLQGFGTRFVERFDVKKSAEHADELVSIARSGTSLIFFAEGTFTRHTGLTPFQTGAFHVAAQAGIPVIPVALRGIRSVLRDGTWLPRRAPVAITFGAPIAPDGADWSAAVRLRDRVRAEILKHCGEPDLAAAPGGDSEET